MIDGGAAGDDVLPSWLTQHFSRRTPASICLWGRSCLLPRFNQGPFVLSRHSSPSAFVDYVCERGRALKLDDDDDNMAPTSTTPRENESPIDPILDPVRAVLLVFAVRVTPPTAAGSFFFFC